MPKKTQQPNTLDSKEAVAEVRSLAPAPVGARDPPQLSAGDQESWTQLPRAQGARRA
jgi:hypothetical protein